MAIIVNDPNTLGGSPTTVKSYVGDFGILLCELRRLQVGSTIYFWTRVTVRVGGNSYINPVCTVDGTKVEWGWTSGDNHTPGSIFCSKAIGFSGYPTQVSSFSGSYGFGSGTSDKPGTVSFTSY